MIHDSDSDTETPASGLHIGAVGWRHAAWRQAFYPEDLPEDWQLGYYANEFSTLLLPADDCSGDPAAQAQQLLDEVPESFVFYLQCPAAPDACDAVRALAEQLAQRSEQQLGGLIGATPLPGINSYGLDAGDDRQRLWTPDNRAASGVGLMALGSTDIKGWRQRLEQFQQCSGGNPRALLLSDAGVNMSGLLQLKTLAELMGL